MTLTARGDADGELEEVRVGAGLRVVLVGRGVERCVDLADAVAVVALDAPTRGDDVGAREPVDGAADGVPADALARASSTVWVELPPPLHATESDNSRLASSTVDKRERLRRSGIRFAPPAGCTDHWGRRFKRQQPHPHVATVAGSLSPYPASMARSDRVHTVLPREPRSAAIARRFVNDTLTRWGWVHRDDDVVQLLVSELVTNALVHARSDVRLDVGHHRDRLRVSVEDRSTRQPAQREQRTWSVDGRGLQLVDALAADWGVTQTRRGKSVWFELRWPTESRQKAAESARWAR